MLLKSYRKVAVSDGKKKSRQFPIGMINVIDQFSDLCDEDQANDDLVEKQPAVAEYPSKQKYVSYDQGDSDYN
jgi:hypothetical protein